MKQKLIETIVSVGKIIEQDRSRLPSGVLARASYLICNVNRLNKNRRLYEKEVWDRVLQDKEIQERIKKRNLWACDEHPEESQRTKTPDIAAIVTGIRIDEKENKVYADFDILDTPKGKIIDALLRANCGIGVSTRADGELEEMTFEELREYFQKKGYEVNLDEAVPENERNQRFYRVVPEQYEFRTVDFTAEPSTIGGDVPLSVEKNIVGIVKEGLNEGKIDKDFAQGLLSAMKCNEAKCLLGSMKEIREQSIEDITKLGYIEDNEEWKKIKKQLQDLWKKKEELMSDLTKSAEDLAKSFVKKVMSGAKRVLKPRKEVISPSGLLGELFLSSSREPEKKFSVHIVYPIPGYVEKATGTIMYRHPEKGDVRIVLSQKVTPKDVIELVKKTKDYLLGDMNAAEVESLAKYLGFSVEESRKIEEQVSDLSKEEVIKYVKSKYGVEADLVEKTTIETLGEGWSFLKKTSPSGYEPVAFLALDGKFYRFVGDKWVAESKQVSEASLEDEIDKQGFSKPESLYLVNDLYGGFSNARKETEKGETVKSGSYLGADDVIDYAKKHNLPVYLAGDSWKEIGREGWGEKVSPEEAEKALQELRKKRKAVPENVLSKSLVLSEEDKKQLQEKTIPEAFDFLLQKLNKLEIEKVLERAERDKVSELYEQKIERIRKDLQDTVELHLKKHRILAETKEEEISNIKVQVEERNKRIKELQEQIKSLKEKVQKAVKEIAEKVKGVYEEKIKRIEERHKRELFEKTVIERKVKDLGLQLPKKALALLKQCKTEEEVDALLERVRYELRESLLHYKGGDVKIGFVKQQTGGFLQDMVDSTKRLLD